ncbi:heparan-alpha-glucosaminide N-acetyltransferase-like isoform X2 [Artemia franciscana]|uniref:heparan-alpha-glucosaminide N-acetyltransferase-like isoform X2 n=1 Tax=Artemia franciscana TaxID=6661 RepID=UPI0032DA527A
MNGHPTKVLMITILYSSIFYLCLAVASYLTIYGSRKFQEWKANQKRNENDAYPAADSTCQNPQKTKRLASLDTFRGLSIVVMIFVNGGGGGYWFFQHATWDGLLVADLVFPWFIWIMGVCIPMAITGQLKRKEAEWTVFKGILRRSATLFFIGACLGSRGQPIETLRIPGVLQRFAVCYLFSATLVLFSLRLMHQKEPEGASVLKLTDVSNAWPHWVAILVLLAIHTGLTFGLPVPGCPTGYLGPGGLHDNASYPDFCIGGATGYIDKILLTESHIYKFPTAREVYKSGSFDPEGILGSVTSIIQTLLGVQTGITILTFKDKKRRLASWLSFAILFGLLGGALCNFTQFGGIIPVNKNLWSISYVLVTTCFALIILSVFYLLIDVYNIWNGAPLVFPGKNSIVMYVGHSLCYNMLPWNWSYGKMNTHEWLYAECLWGTTMWVVLAYWMNEKRIFIAL